MSVLLEFSIPTDAFQLGGVLAGPPAMQLELERVVPTGEMVMPFVWATGEDHEAFESSVRERDAIADLSVLDAVGDSRLYRIEWAAEPRDLTEGIARADAVVLEARGDGDWTFRMRFPDHDRLSTFHNYVIEHSIPIHIDRTYTLTESTDRGHRFGLTPDQREALVLALRRGYFETPSEVALDELADELDITRQALSTRIRRGNEKVLRTVLFAAPGRFDRDGA
jgi:predicted DNA binding protein